MESKGYNRTGKSSHDSWQNIKHSIHPVHRLTGSLSRAYPMCDIQAQGLPSTVEKFNHYHPKEAWKALLHSPGCSPPHCTPQNDGKNIVCLCSRGLDSKKTTGFYQETTLDVAQEDQPRTHSTMWQIWSKMPGERWGKVGLIHTHQGHMTSQGML